MISDDLVEHQFSYLSKDYEKLDDRVTKISERQIQNMGEMKSIQGRLDNVDHRLDCLNKNIDTLISQNNRLDLMKQIGFGIIMFLATIFMGAEKAIEYWMKLS